MSNTDFCTHGCHLSLGDRTPLKHRILLCIGLSCWSFLQIGEVGEFWDLEEKVTNPQKILEVGRLSEGRAQQSRLGVVWIFLLVHPEICMGSKILNNPLFAY